VTAPSGILGLLARIVVADDLDAARAAWPGLPDDVTIITRDGDVLTAHVIRGGTGGARSRLELAAERDAAQERLSEVTTAIERLGYTLAGKREELDVARIDAKQ